MEKKEIILIDENATLHNKNDKNISNHPNNLGKKNKITHPHTQNILKPKKKAQIKTEYSELKPNILRAHNIRFVEPFSFKYQLYAKGRWVGKKLIDVLINEFPLYDRNYFLSAFKNQNLQINGGQVDEDYTIKSADFISHTTTRRENPIIDVKLDIIHDDENFLAVDKPSSWPIHVCGGYFFNTLLRILTDEYGYNHLKTMHRLDKHTSGVVIFAKNKETAEKFGNKISKDNIGKNYFCRVRGDFHHDKINVVRSIKYLNRAKGIFTDVDDVDAKNENRAYYATDCEQDNDSTIEKKKSKYDKAGVLISGNDEDDDDESRNSPKYAETFFEKVFYDNHSNTSVVIAKPKTGRTHQIRIHLRYLGYPIANDPCYGGIIFNDLKELSEYNSKGNINPDMLKYQQYVPEDEPESQLNADSQENLHKSTVIKNEPTDLTDTIKLECDPISVSQMYCYKIWLHSWKYIFDGYEFSTQIPEWAKEGYKIDYRF